jgi:hypothetical protein
MNNVGKLTVWRTEGPPKDMGEMVEMVFAVSANLTSGNERLIVVDAVGCFDPARVSRAAASVARNLHVLRTFPGAEQQTSLWAKVRSLQERTQARRVLLVGVLDHLYDRGILTRDAARALGRIKLVLEALTRSGLEVTVVCKGDDTEMGPRTYLVSSLCASAQEVYRWPLPAQEYINGASAAIA